MTATNDLDSGSDNDEENEDDSDDNTDDTSYEDVFKLTLALPKLIARKKTRSTPLLPHHLSGDTAILQMEKRIQDKVEAEAEKRRTGREAHSKAERKGGAENSETERTGRETYSEAGRKGSKRREETPETEARGRMSPTAEERQKEDSKADCRAAKQLYLSCLWYR